jgi:DNA-binding response OmpR family regulator
MLVTDVVLPGMNGRELAKRLKALRPTMQVLFTSGYTRDVIAEHGILEPGTTYIAKPYTPSELSAMVRELLSKPPGDLA